MLTRFIFRLILTILLCAGNLAYARDEGELYPPAPELEKGYLKVDDLHELFYVCCGNPDGKPVLCLHGGPGVGCYPRMTQYFNPEKYYIVLHDQRGAGLSKPHGELKANTTWDLVEDIEKLRKHRNLGKVLIFGGSWGSTLALAYTETYPDNVSGLILRGIFLGTEEEIEFHYLGTGFFFPQEQEALLSILPDRSHGTHPDYLYTLMQGEDKELGAKVVHALARFEFKFMKLAMPDERIEAYLGSTPDDRSYRVACLDLHYVTNRYFLEDGQLLKNIGKLKEIPVTLINGRYDMATPPRAAFRVHKALPQSNLIIVEEAGHSESEEGITEALVRAVAEFE